MNDGCFKLSDDSCLFGVPASPASLPAQPAACSQSTSRQTKYFSRIVCFLVAEVSVPVLRTPSPLPQYHQAPFGPWDLVMPGKVHRGLGAVASGPLSQTKPMPRARGHCQRDFHAACAAMPQNAPLSPGWLVGLH